MRGTRTLTLVEDGASTRREELLPTTSDSSHPNAAARRARRQRRFTQIDVISALKAAQKSGVPIASVRIEPDGAIQIIPAKPDAVAVSCEPNDWD